MNEILDRLLRACGCVIQKVPSEHLPILMGKHPWGYDVLVAAVQLRSALTDEFLREDVPRIRAEIRTALEDEWSPDMAKNTQLVVCVDVTSGMSTDFYDQVYRVEEDPYFFKKNVLIYERSHADALLMGMKQRESDVLPEDVPLFVDFRDAVFRPIARFPGKTGPQSWGGPTKQRTEVMETLASRFGRCRC